MMWQWLRDVEGPKTYRGAREFGLPAGRLMVRLVVPAEDNPEG